MHPAYVAGILDGEGHLGFGRTRQSFFPRIIVVNTDMDLLDGLNDEFGGDVREMKANRQYGWKPAYSWRVQWSRAVDIIDGVYDYLIIKKVQARAFQLWREIAPGKGQLWDDISLSCLDLLIDEVNWWNKRGIRNGIPPCEQYLSEAGKSKKKK